MRTLGGCYRITVTRNTILISTFISTSIVGWSAEGISDSTLFDRELPRNSLHTELGITMIHVYGIIRHNVVLLSAIRVYDGAMNLVSTS